MSRVNIAIIGGGLVGASLAMALQAGAKARGWRITLIERFAPGDSYQPSYDARSSALSFGTRQIYDRLGVWQAISRHAEPIKQIHVSDRGRFGVTRLTAIEEGVPALGYVVENAWLGTCLWQGLDPEVVSWHCPREVRTLQTLPDGYQLVLDDGTRLECDLAVIADGGRSDLREQLGIGVRTRPYDQSALIANITPVKPITARPSSASPMMARWRCCRCRKTAARWSGPAWAWTHNGLPTLTTAPSCANCRRPSATAWVPCSRLARAICTRWRWWNPKSRSVLTWPCSAMPPTACTRLPARVSTCRCATCRRWPRRYWPARNCRGISPPCRPTANASVRINN